MIKCLKYIILLNLNYMSTFSYYFLMKNLNLSVIFFYILKKIYVGFKIKRDIYVISLNFKRVQSNFFFFFFFYNSRPQVLLSLPYLKANQSRPASRCFFHPQRLCFSRLHDAF